jgi:hypothetical protein
MKTSRSRVLGVAHGSLGFAGWQPFYLQKILLNYLDVLALRNEKCYSYISDLLKKIKLPTYTQDGFDLTTYMLQSGGNTTGPYIQGYTYVHHLYMCILQ